MRVAAIALLFAAVLAASTAAAAPPAGGTYRVGWEQMTFDNLDPATAYADTFALFAHLLTRTLVQYRHISGPGAARLVPDLAVRVPRPTRGGTTYTFRLKRGIRFGPPLGRTITSADVRYAFERLARLRNNPYPYFRVIRGFDAFGRGETRTIAGIRTPDVRTVVFTLTRPTGDFLHRLTVPAASPVPPEVARCFERMPRRYGSYLVASGPYTIEGADAARAGPCASLRPLRGLADDRLVLVRNPSYDPRTDSRAAREANPDRFVFVAPRAGGARTAITLAGKVLEGELDDVVLYSLPKALRRYTSQAAAHGRLRVSYPYWRLQISMKFTQPPFDDVHVRRALSWVLDRAALLEAAGGRLRGRIPRHIVADDLLGGRLTGFAPFSTPGERGDVAKARAEMARSHYATRRGICVARACKRVWLTPITASYAYAIGQRVVPLIKAGAAKIGITFSVHSRYWDRAAQPSNNIAVVANSDWGSEYLDPSAFFERVVDGATILPRDNRNWSLVGITRAQARRLGVKGRVDRVPSVDRDLARCRPLTGSRRLDCYAALDRKLSTQIVPWIPFLWHSRINILGRQVAKWRFDQSTGTTSFAHVALRR